MSFALKQAVSVLVCITSMFLYQQETYAEEATEALSECAPEYGGTRHAVIEHEGAAGIWFALPIANCILRDLQVIPLLRERISLLEDSLSIRDIQLSRLRELMLVTEENNTAILEALELAQEAQRNAEERADAWYRSPVLWFSTGFVVAGAIVALAAYALNSVD